MGPRLIAVVGPLLNMEFPLDDEVTVIGRDAAATVCVKSRSASRRHCEVRRDRGQYLIRDLGSSNGTLVNGLPVTECVLQHGDRIAVSDSVFVFAVDLQAERALRPEVTESGDATPLEFSSVYQAEPRNCNRPCWTHPSNLRLRNRPRYSCTSNSTLQPVP